MGMFDTVMCSYDLGPGFWNRPLQTKDLLCMMDEYWLDPKGKLWEYDYSGTYDYDEKFKPVKNGRRGVIRPHLLTHSITLYPAKWDNLCMMNQTNPKYMSYQRSMKEQQSQHGPCHHC
jgi:hypothetical protein